MLNPSAMKAWYRRGDCYLHLFKFKSALSDFKQAQILEPTYAQIHDKVKCGKPSLKLTSRIFLVSEEGEGGGWQIFTFVQLRIPRVLQ